MTTTPAWLRRLAAFALFCTPWASWANGDAHGIDAQHMGTLWAAPFVTLLLCIALLPLWMPKLWHAHFGKISLLCALGFLLPFALSFGVSAAARALIASLLDEYIPFIILLTALYTVSGGIYVRGNLHGSAELNVLLLTIGAMLASFMGTTGASMLLIRPLIRANDNRPHKAHVVVFFIFIVSNVAGALTPLGDPPLFLGFLQGVNFFWPLAHLWQPTAFLIGSLLLIFYALDRWYFGHEGVLPQDPTPDTRRIGLDGTANFFGLLAIVALVLQSGMWSHPSYVTLGTFSLPVAGLVRDVGLLLVIALSWRYTPTQVHTDNQFTWAPMAEVAKLFAGIFITIVPVIALLRLGAVGPFASVIHAVTGADGQPNPAMYFWATGSLSSFLDNAPTYLVFFNTAGGEVAQLMGPLANTLLAISAGAVFMGANTYIGNAPNMMVKAIAEERGVAMPHFFAYMAWSGLILLPLFGAITWIWFA